MGPSKSSQRTHTMTNCAWISNLLHHSKLKIPFYLFFWNTLVFPHYQEYFTLSFLMLTLFFHFVPFLLHLPLFPLCKYLENMHRIYHPDVETTALVHCLVKGNYWWSSSNGNSRCVVVEGRKCWGLSSRREGRKRECSM